MSVKIKVVDCRTLYQRALSTFIYRIFTRLGSVCVIVAEVVTKFIHPMQYRMYFFINKLCADIYLGFTGQSGTVEPPITDPPTRGQPLYMYKRH